MRVLLLGDEGADGAFARELARLADILIVMRFEEGLGGVWSEYPEGHELIRVGYPANSSMDFFRVLNPVPDRETCASVVLGRTVFGRRISDVIVRDAALLTMTKHALAGHDVRCWFGDSPVKPEALPSSGSAATENKLIEGLSRCGRGAVA